ncbi:MAG: hypothetical protein RML93_13510 [Anaerolineales bacterium]|nr:hypothetical protein [Anaerolineales bacterium]MCS7247700.1 hypothetical protein [Anaerolineales bacterium]MDW8161510.1 hypothetical protein [Anaerolineales bacterium]MDW8448291.1 hypothetical protein [Anaerolineales bacterium]
MNPTLAIAIPFLLLPTTAAVFALATRLLGAEAGYLFGFGFYWLFWCLFVPQRLLGKTVHAGHCTQISDHARGLG